MLSEIFRKEIRLSILLKEQGLSDDQISTIRKDYLDPLIQLILNTLKDFIFAGRDAERLWMVLCERFGLAGHSVKTLQVVSIELGISRERVRQLEKKAIRKLVLKRRKAILLERIRNFVEESLKINLKKEEDNVIESRTIPMNTEKPVTTSRLSDNVMDQQKVYPRENETWTKEEEQFLQVQYPIR